MNDAKTLTYADRCRKIAYALRDLPWTTKEAEIYQIFDALDSFREGGSEVSTVRAVLTALRKTKNGHDFDRVCSWASEWLAYHINIDRVCTWASEWLAYHINTVRPAIEKFTDAQV